MRHFITGPVGPKRLVMLILVLLFAVTFSQVSWSKSLQKTTLPKPQATWSASTLLDNPDQLLSQTDLQLLLSENDWTAHIEIAPGSTELTLYLTNPSAMTLPVNEALALITVEYSDGREQRFQARSDGGGLIILIDEF